MRSRCLKNAPSNEIAAPPDQCHRSYAVGTLYTRDSRQRGNPVTEIVIIISVLFATKRTDSCCPSNDEFVISSA